MRSHKSSISKAKSYKEIADFWDSRDLADFWEQTKSARFDIEIASEVTYYSLDQSLSDQLRKTAKKRGISPDTLINLWIQERLLLDSASQMGKKLRVKPVRLPNQRLNPKP